MQADRLINRVVLNGLILLIFIAPFSLGGVTSGALTLIQLMILGLFALKMLAVVHEEHLELRHREIHMLLFALIALVGVQLLFKSLLPHGQILGATVYQKATEEAALKLIFYCLFFWLILMSLRSEEEISKLTKSIVFAAFLISLLGILQKLSGTPRIYWLKETGYGAAFFGTFINPNHFAAFVGMAVFLGLGRLLYLHARYDRSMQSKQVEKNLLFYLLMVMVGALFFSLSRTGMVFFSVALLFLYLWLAFVLKKKGPGFLLLLLLFSAILLLAWIGIGDVLVELSTVFRPAPDPGLLARWLAWKTTWGIFQGFPWLGTGLGTFQYVFPHQKPEELFGFWRHAHNEWIQFLSETGILGIILCLGLVFALLKRGLDLKSPDFQADPYVKYMGLGCLAALVYIFGLTVFDFPLRIPANMLLLVLIAAFLFKMEESVRRTIAAGAKTTGAGLKSPRKGSVPLGRKVMSATLLSLCFALGLLIVSPYSARALVEKGGRGSVSHLRQAIRLDPSNADYYFQLGLALGENAFYARNRYNHEKMKEAFRTIERALELNPWNAKYYYGLALLSQKIMDKEGAMRHFEKAMRLDPSNPFYHLYYAIFCFNQAFIQAETLDDFSASPFLPRGVIAYKKARQIDPDLRLAQYQDSIIDYVRLNHFLHQEAIVPDGEVA